MVEINKDKKIFEQIYEKPGAIWTRPGPPLELIELVESGKIKPCKVLDVGCGEGIYSIYLASKGFDVLGIDYSKNAIGFAKQNAKDVGVDVRFVVMNIDDLCKLEEKFDFVLEWAIMHHVMLEQREKYVACISGLLNSGGRYLSICFNDQNPEFGGVGEKYRVSPVGTRLYFSSQEELKKLFGLNFCVIENKIITMFGRDKEVTFIGNYFFMEKNENK